MQNLNDVHTLLVNEICEQNNRKKLFDCLGSDDITILTSRFLKQFGIFKNSHPNPT